MITLPMRFVCLSAVLFLTPLPAQQFVITRVAGGALPATPAPGASVSVHYPDSLFVDRAGNTYFATMSAVLKLDQNGVVTRVAGSPTLAGYAGDGGPAANAQLYFPSGLAADQAGNVYIADSGNAVIRKVTPSGIISTYAGNGGYGSSGDGGPATQATLSYPVGLAVDGNGNLFIGDGGNGTIRKVASDGTISTVLLSGVNGAYGLATDAQGNLYIADPTANVVRVLRAQGGLTAFAGTGAAGYAGDEAAALNARLSAPYGVATDTTGNVYISDTGNNVIRKVDSSGIITTVAGNNSYPYTVIGDGNAATSAGLFYPYGAGVDPQGNLYICDLAHNRIRKVTADGIIHTVVGGGAASGGDNGPATAAQLNSPYGIAMDNAGYLYIADTFNNKVRKVAPNGVITTLAGTGAPGSTGNGGPAASARLNNPYAVAADNKGNIFIADGSSGVRKVDAGGRITQFAGVQYGAGFAFDAAGNLYMSQLSTSQIWKIAPNGIGDVYAGVSSSRGGYGGDGGPALQATFNLPWGLAVDSKGNVYVADSGNHRLRKISASGAVTTIAGTGIAGYSGDGGPAIQAQLNNPYGVAVDASDNLYIADYSNARIRKIDSNGVISTIAGTSGFGYQGDGGLAANAVLGTPTGLAFDSHGDLFVSDQYFSAVRVLTPVNGPPVLTLSYSHPSLAYAGQALSSSIIVGNAASAGATSGTVIVTLSLPTNITLNSMSGDGWFCSDSACTRRDALAAGATYPPIVVNATLPWTANTQVTMTALVSGDGSLFSTNAQDVFTILTPGSYCTYALDAAGADLSPAAGNGAVQVSADAYCAWSASADQPWVTVSASGSGPGSVSYSVAANPGSARTATLTIGGQTFTISQAGAASASLPLAGVLAHFASGDGWASTLTVVNTGAAPAEAAVSFYNATGAPVALPSTFPQTPGMGARQVETWNQTLGAGALSVLDTRQTGKGAVGSAQLRGAAGIGGFEVFSNLSSGQQAVVPLETRNAASYILPFDNTGVLGTGLAIANISSSKTAVNVVIRDDTGTTIGTKVEALEPLGHDSFMLTNYEQTAARRGTVEFDPPSGAQISVLGLRVNGNAFTTLPVLANVGTGGGSFAHFASGDRWQTAFTVVNTGATSAQFTLKFYDANGAAAGLPLTSPELGNLGTVDTVARTLAPGASVLLTTQGVTGLTGSARLDSTSPVSGFAAFRSDAGQEAVVPLETRQGTFVLAFDNTSGLGTGLAMANFSTQPNVVGILVRDDTGAPLQNHTESLDALGHDSFMLEKWPETVGKRGTVEFTPQAGAQIGVIGLRVVGATGVITTIPVLLK